MIALEGDAYDASPQQQMTRSTRRFAELGTTSGEQLSTNHDVGPESFAETAASLVLPAASYINGAVLLVDGGLSIQNN